MICMDCVLNLQVVRHTKSISKNYLFRFDFSTEFSTEKKIGWKFGWKIRFHYLEMTELLTGFTGNRKEVESIYDNLTADVYVSSNIDQRYLKVGIEKYNANQKYIRVWE